jgi:glucose-1-phosphate thymidylyltransferase
MQTSMAPPTKVIGLLPAAGQGTRISPLPMSKELFPIGFRAVAGKSGPRPKVVCHYLLEKMHQAGITEAFLILRPGKWDIPEFLGDGADLGMRLAYLTVHVPFGVPFSLHQAYPFIQNATVVMGFPDILFRPDDAYKVLLERLHTGNADVILGLFPTDQPEKVGVVDFDASGQVQGIYEKSNFTHLRYMWAIAAWRPSFTEFLHQFVTDRQYQLIGNQAPQNLKEMPPYTEVPIGDVIQASIQAGLKVAAHPFETGSYLDIGTPENLMTAIQQHLNSV